MIFYSVSRRALTFHYFSVLLLIFLLNFLNGDDTAENTESIIDKSIRNPDSETTLPDSEKPVVAWVKNKTKTAYYKIKDIVSLQSNDEDALTHVAVAEVLNAFESRVEDPSNASSSAGLDYRYDGNAEELKEEIREIAPAARFCGDTHENPNKSAEIYGFAQVCCDLLDTCPKKILPFQVHRGLENMGIFIRYHCDCDNDFYNCLKAAHNVIADALGKTYFNILQLQCFFKVRTTEDPKGHYEWVDTEFF